MPEYVELLDGSEQAYPRMLAAIASAICGLGGGWRLRLRYLDAFASARERIHVAHGYFLPDPGVVRAITAAARRGVQVRLVLAGHPFVADSTPSARPTGNAGVS